MFRLCQAKKRRTFKTDAQRPRNAKDHNEIYSKFICPV